MLWKLVLPFYRVLNSVLGKVRAAQSRRLPKAEIKQVHVRNLRVVSDRVAFLEAMPKGGVIAEVGVDQGEFSAQILSITKPERLHLIDMWSSKRYHAGLEHVVRGRFSKELAEGRIHIDKGRSLEVLKRFPDAYFDWIYLDTDHSYPTTAAELMLCSTKVKAEGMIAGHDFVTGNWDAGVRYGVVEAVHEFCVGHNWEFVLLTHETDRYLSFAIRSIGATANSRSDD